MSMEKVYLNEIVFKIKRIKLESWKTEESRSDQSQ